MEHREVSKLPPLAVYVHLPWCVAKCPYCDFNSHVAPASLPEARYVDALLEDLRHDLTTIEAREVAAVFFGGGTPSLFSPGSIAKFLRGLAAELPLAPAVEVTLEANPGTIEHGRFEGYRDAGVTRVSLGVQSFDDAQLRKLGRIHDSRQVDAAVSELRAAGYENFNLDLMYGLPEQALAEAIDDLQRAIDLGPAHISHYQLTMEPGTVFYHRRPHLPDDDVTWEMQTACQAKLAEHGFSQYEVSAYARSGAQCHHNLNYWQFGDYLGLGAGAHGKSTSILAGKTEIIRSTRRKQPREYLAFDAAARLSENCRVSRNDLPFEFALNALRLNAGFTQRLFEARTGLEFADIAEVLRAAKQRGLIWDESGSAEGIRVAPTDLGRRFLNDLVGMFVPDAAA